MARRLSALFHDVLIVIVFATIGHGVHRGPLTLVGVAEIAWPFLVGTVVGHLLVSALRGGRETSPNSLPSGAVVWVWTISVAMVLRRVSRAGTDPVFIALATVVFGLAMLGWRLAVQRFR